MNWREAHEEAMFAAADAHEELRLDTTRRIDVFATIEEIGLELLFRPLRGASGLYVPGTHRTDGGVLINSNHRLARQRFTGAHELGHFWLEHEVSLDLQTEFFTRADDRHYQPQEMTAEAFAAWFLMPPELVDAVLDELGLSTPSSSDDVYALSLRMGTSYEATAYHLPNLKLASYDNAREWATQPPKRVKAALSMGVEMISYHHDVWSLSERDADAEFRVRAGDRLVVTLAEIPSSGYMWSTMALPTGARVVADTMTDALITSRGIDEQEDQEPPGSPHPRTVIVDVDDTVAGALDVTLVKAPVWAPQAGTERFLVHLEVEQPLLGRPAPD